MLHGYGNLLTGYERTMNRNLQLTADASSLPEKIAFIELHDADIGSFTLQPGGTLEINFTHLAVYFETGPLVYEVRSYEASLLLEGVRRFELDGTLADDDYVMDDELTRPDGTPGDWNDLIGKRGPFGELVLSFFFAARVSISAQTGLLTLKGEGSFMKIWEGPLSDSES